ncbi:MAG: UbiD family decarboxylase domain-containing protein [Phycisphaerales bacterium]
MYPTTRDFVNALDRAGELKRVRASTNPVLEVSAIADRVSKSLCAVLPSAAAKRTDPAHHHLGGHALLFDNVQGSNFPLLINAWGSYHRMEMALGGDTPAGFEAIAGRIADLVKPQPPRSLRELLGLANRLRPLLTIPPKRKRGSGLCQEMVLTGEKVDLTRLPLIRCWPLDGDLASVGYPADVNDHVPGLGTGPEWQAKFRGRYITLGGVHTVHADDRDDPKPASHNIGMYRAQLLGKNRLAMHWHMHHDGARHWRSWKKLGQPMPVAIALGGESVMPYAATAPLPPGLSELLLAGYLNRGGIPLVRAKTVPLWVPANAEIVIEGWVSAEAGGIGWTPPKTAEMANGKWQMANADRYGLGPGAVFEGPFGDHTGFYSMPDRYPIFDVTAITHRREAIYPTTIVGPPPQEDYYLGKATERIFLPLLKTLIPDIEDYDLPMFGAFHNCAFVKIKKQYPLQARRVMHSVWGAGQMAWTKTVFVVDDDVDVHDAGAVLRAAAANCVPSRDIERVHGPLDILDHAAPRLGAGMKIGFDCTRKVVGEEVDGNPLNSSEFKVQSPHTQGIVAAARAVPGVLGAALHADGWLLVKISKAAPGDGHRAIERIASLLAHHSAPNEAPAQAGALSPPSLPRAAAPARAIRFLIILGQDANIGDTDNALFHWLANSDASRDAEVIGGVWCVDATPKFPGDQRNGQAVRPWPPLMSMHEGLPRASDG